LLSAIYSSTGRKKFYIYQPESDMGADLSAAIRWCCDQSGRCEWDRLSRDGISPKRFLAPGASLHVPDLVPLPIQNKSLCPGAKAPSSTQPFNGSKAPLEEI